MKQTPMCLPGSFVSQPLDGKLHIPTSQAHARRHIRPPLTKHVPDMDVFMSYFQRRCTPIIGIWTDWKKVVPEKKKVLWLLDDFPTVWIHGD